MVDEGPARDEGLWPKRLAERVLGNSVRWKVGTLVPSEACDDVSLEVLAAL